MLMVEVDVDNDVDVYWAGIDESSIAQEVTTRLQQVCVSVFLSVCVRVFVCVCLCECVFVCVRS